MKGAAGFMLAAAGRSFYPLAALAIITGTLLWGPIVSLVLAYVCWRAAGRYA